MNQKSARGGNLTADRTYDEMLRPVDWSDYVGQEKVKSNLRVIVESAKRRKDVVDHLLFYGPSGLGKTTLAHLIAKEVGAGIKITSGVNMEKSGDVAAMLAQLEPGDVLFVDEAHRINRMIEEALYPAMESRKLYMKIGKGPAARTITVDLPPFTLIGATTRLNLLSSPLRSRFGGIFNLDYYNKGEMEQIVRRACSLLGLSCDDEAVALFAKASRFTPRVANRILKRARDFAEVENIKLIDREASLRILKFLDIDEAGLEKWDRKLIEIIIKRFGGGPVGLRTLSSLLGEEKGIIEEIYEPFLLKLGFVEKTTQGRIATRYAYEHLRIPYKPLE